MTHDSFSLPDDLVAAFEKESGYQLDVRQVGDGGTLTNELVLTKDSPLGDVAFGVDNTFASRALEEGVFAPYDFDAPAGVEDHALPGDDEHALTPVDNANVCVNVDDTWFAKEGLDPPRDLDDLTDPAYRGLSVTPGAATSTPGTAFLLTTIAAYGDDWPDYWEDLLGNGAKITKGWRTPTTSTSPRVAAMASGRSCCRPTPRQRRPWPTGRRRPARCSTPASSRSSTPA